MVWERLPDLLLEQVFAMLDMRTRYRASMVCQHWQGAFYCPTAWRELHVKEGMFMYLRLHPLRRGYVREISPHRVQMYLGQVGHHTEAITIHPLTNFHMLAGFIQVLSSFIEFFDEYPMPYLDKFSFTFGCELRGLTGTIILGTGGEILREVKRLLGNFHNLRELTLNQLRLSSSDSIGILDNVVKNCGESLEHLEMLNCTVAQYPMFSVAMFSNLRKLAITPPQLNSHILLRLAAHKNFEELTLVQDEYTPQVEQLDHLTWLEVRLVNPEFKVRLEVRGKATVQVMIQERAPVHTVMYTSHYSKVSTASIVALTDEYPKTLRSYGHKLLPRTYMPRSFHERADTSLVLLIRECPNIETLVISELVSTSTLLIIASEAKRLRTLHVRRNAVLKRFDWPRASHWSDAFYEWLKKCSRHYELVEREVSRLLKRRWYMLPDHVFKRLTT